uniref:Acyl-CoA dehydrogenase n=1 Tax=Denticeps clupeoides TaxID=299321 RepID=A0AAY4BSU7_9TELE
MLPLTQPKKTTNWPLNFTYFSNLSSMVKAFIESRSKKIHNWINPKVVITPNICLVTDMDIIAKHRHIYTPEHNEFRERLRNFFNEELEPYQSLYKLDKYGTFSRSMFEKAGAEGLLGVSLPKQHGGTGDFRLAAVLWQEQMYAGCIGPEFPVHSDIVMPYITKYGSEAQIKRYIPDMLAGKCIGAIALKEPEIGNVMKDIATQAIRTEDGWMLTGIKTKIPNGLICDLVIVAAVTKPNANSVEDMISLFLVENGNQGFIKSKKLEKPGLEAENIAESLFFDYVFLPEDALLGEVNKGYSYIMEQLPIEDLLHAEKTMASCEFTFDHAQRRIMKKRASEMVHTVEQINKKLAHLRDHISATRMFIDGCIYSHIIKTLDADTASRARDMAKRVQDYVYRECIKYWGTLSWPLGGGMNFPSRSEQLSH